jgi:hypothetical protein
MEGGSLVVGGVLAGGAGLYGLVGKLKGHRGIRSLDTPAVTHTRSQSFDLWKLCLANIVFPLGATLQAPTFLSRRRLTGHERKCE